jgi:O-antigen ligase
MRKLVDVALRREPGIIRALFFVAPFVTLLAPKTTVPALILLFAGCVGLALAHGQRPKSLFQFDVIVALLAAAAVYLFVNASWSLDPSRAVGKAVWFTLVAAMSFGAWRAIASWERPQIQIATTAFLAGLAVGVAIILFEAATGRFLTISLYNLLPFTRPESVKALVIKDGDVFRIAAFELNRNVTVMLLTLWPALLCLAVRGGQQTRLLRLAALFLGVLVSVFLSTHESSKVGILLSVIVFAVALAWPVFARRAVLAGWCLAFILVVPLATLAYKAELHQADWLPYSASTRVTLWAYTAEQVPEAPFLGIGATSTRKMDLDREDRQKPNQRQNSNDDFGWRAGPHAHNVFLQTWYELGAVGAVLFMVAGAAVIVSVGRLPRASQAYMLAHIAAFVMILAFAWGLWQSWLMALAGLAALYAALAVSLTRADAVAALPQSPDN